MKKLVDTVSGLDQGQMNYMDTPHFQCGLNYLAQFVQMQVCPEELNLLTKIQSQSESLQLTVILNQYQVHIERHHNDQG